MSRIKLLENKTAFVTGGSKGIGFHIVKGFLEQGVKYLLYFSRSESKDHSILKEISDENGAILRYVQGDVSDKGCIIETISSMVKEAGSLDIVVNNAGITKDKLIIGMKDEDWNDVININLTGTFNINKTATMHMIKQRSGSIINISSIVGVTGNAGQTNYSASKAGVIGFSKSLAREIARRGVRVNVVAPGFIKTDMTDSIRTEYKEKLLDQIPMGRVGKAKEIADACIFLSSHMASYITGQVLFVTGGM